MSHSEITNIHYLSVLPGAGKTHYAIGRISKFVLDRTDELAYGYCIYVAPTLALLREVMDSIATKCSQASGLPEKEFQGLLHLVTGNSDHNSLNSRSSVQDRLENLYKQKKSLTPGSVIFMTHEGFLRCLSIPYREITTVYFDEARSFVHKLGFNDKSGSRGRTSQPSLDKSLNLQLSRFLLSHTRRVYPRLWSSVYERFEPSSQPSETHGILSCTLEEGKSFLKSLECSIGSNAPNQVGMLYELIYYATNPRIDLYVRLVDSSSFALRTYVAHSVISPSRAFRGFHRVLLMGAYLSDSQMYRLLEADPQVNLVDIRSNPKLDLKFNLRARAIKRSFGKIKFIALTRSGKLISSRYLSDAIIIPTNNVAAFEVQCGESGWDHDFVLSVRNLLMDSYSNTEDEVSLMEGSVLRRLLRTLASSLTKKQKEFISYCIKAGICLSQPIPWLIRRACGEVDNKPFLFSVNTLHEKQAQRLLSHFAPAVPATFLPGNPHGLNVFQHISTIVYLSARNLSPDTVAFFRAVLPNYDITADHTANCLVQAITRTSLRNVDSPRRVTVILPDKGTAKLAKTKLGLDPESSSGIKISTDDNGATYCLGVSFSTKISIQERKTYKGISTDPEYKYAQDCVKVVRKALTRLKEKLKTILPGTEEHRDLMNRIRLKEIEFDKARGNVISIRSDLIKDRYARASTADPL